MNSILKYLYQVFELQSHLILERPPMHVSTIIHCSQTAPSCGTSTLLQSESCAIHWAGSVVSDYVAKTLLCLAIRVADFLEKERKKKHNLNVLITPII